jgi:hypothetical protein
MTATPEKFALVAVAMLLPALIALITLFGIFWVRRRRFLREKVRRAAKERDDAQCKELETALTSALAMV